MINGPSSISPNLHSASFAALIKHGCPSRVIQYPLRRLSGKQPVPVHSVFGPQCTWHADRAAPHLCLQLWGLLWHWLHVYTWKGEQRNCMSGGTPGVWKQAYVPCRQEGEGRGKRSYRTKMKLREGQKTATYCPCRLDLKRNKWRQKCYKARRVDKASSNWEEEITH